MSSIQKRYLLVDGNYFAHRCIHGIRISQPDFNLTNSQQIFNFEASLNYGLINLYKSFNNDYHNLIDNMVFVFDNKSWRKDVKYEVLSVTNEPTGIFDYFKPYYINDDTLLGYKENRKADKEESDIDYDAFNLCIENFRNKIKPVIPVIHFEGGEGDDALLLLTNNLKDQKIESIIFATDGDLKALVNEYTILLRNVKSKELPDGEFIISNHLNKLLFSEKTIEQRFTELDIYSSYYNLLFNIDVSSGGSSKSNKIRKINSGITVTDPNKNLIVKVICGDKKDNILPIIRWDKGERNFKVTEVMIKKAFEMSLMNYDEKSVREAFEDKKIMSSILTNLRVITKQNNAPLNMIAKHYNHNLKMNKLSIDVLPNYVVDNYSKNFNEISELIYKDLLITDIEKLGLQISKQDSAKNLIVNSVPTDTDNKNYESSGNSIVDDILNGN
jgi:hypothetical protein